MPDFFFIVYYANFVDIGKLVGNNQLFRYKFRYTSTRKTAPDLLKQEIKDQL